MKMLAAVNAALLILFAPCISTAQSAEADWAIIGIDRSAYLAQANLAVRNEILAEGPFVHNERYGLTGFCGHFLQADLQARRLDENADALRVQDACRNRQLDEVADALGLRSVLSDVLQGIVDAYMDDWVNTEYSLLVSEALVEKIASIYESHRGALGADTTVYDLMADNARGNFCVFLSYSPLYETDPSEVDDLIDVCEASARRLRGQISDGVNASIRAQNAIIINFNDFLDDLAAISARDIEIGTRLDQIDRSHPEYSVLIAEDAQLMVSRLEGRLRQVILLYLKIFLHEKQTVLVSLTTPTTPDRALLNEAINSLDGYYDILTIAYLNVLVAANTMALAAEADALAAEADALAAVLWALECVAGVENGTYENNEDCPRP